MASRKKTPNFLNFGYYKVGRFQKLETPQLSVIKNMKQDCGKGSFRMDMGIHKQTRVRKSPWGAKP